MPDENSPPTLLHKAHGTFHRPDLTLVSADLEQHCTEELLRDTSSDHRPVLVKINILKQRNRKKRTRWNFKKANWTLYRSETEKLFLDLSLDEMDVEKLNDTVTSICLKASILSIPRGCTQITDHFGTTNLKKQRQLETKRGRNMTKSLLQRIDRHTTKLSQMPNR